MIFASDNWAGASPPVLDALVRANGGPAPSYGGDAITARLEARFREVFECDLSVFLVATGTAANALSLAALAPPWGGIVCHESSHVMEDECGAAEFYSGGAKLMGLPGDVGKIAAADLAAFLTVPRHAPHHVKPAAPERLARRHAHGRRALGRGEEQSVKAGRQEICPPSARSSCVA